MDEQLTDKQREDLAKLFLKLTAVVDRAIVAIENDEPIPAMFGFSCE